MNANQLAIPHQLCSFIRSLTYLLTYSLNTSWHQLGARYSTR